MKYHLLLVTTLLVSLFAPACSPVNEPCPTPEAGTQLLRDEERGYCLLYPSEYSTNVQGFVIINPAAGPGDVLGDAWMSVDAAPAGGRSAMDVASAEIDSVGSGFNIQRSEITLGGEPAIVVDGLPGPDSWRKVYVVHNDRLYTLTFLPWTEENTPLIGLYEMAAQTFRFFPGN